MSMERKNPLKRGQALNDSTSGQLGEEPRPGPYPDKGREDLARKKSRQM